MVITGTRPKGVPSEVEEGIFPTVRRKRQKPLLPIGIVDYENCSFQFVV